MRRCARILTLHPSEARDRAGAPPTCRRRAACARSCTPRGTNHRCRQQGCRVAFAHYRGQRKGGVTSLASLALPTTSRGDREREKGDHSTGTAFLGDAHVKHVNNNSEYKAYLESSRGLSHYSCPTLCSSTCFVGEIWFRMSRLFYVVQRKGLRQSRFPWGERNRQNPCSCSKSISVATSAKGWLSEPTVNRGAMPVARFSGASQSNASRP